MNKEEGRRAMEEVMESVALLTDRRQLIEETLKKLGELGTANSSS
jgi:hypothetical protein